MKLCQFCCLHLVQYLYKMLFNYRLFETERMRPNQYPVLSARVVASEPERTSGIIGPSRLYSKYVSPYNKLGCEEKTRERRN